MDDKLVNVRNLSIFMIKGQGSVMSDEKETEQGFNESELQDIMSEIENLEEEFSSGDKAESLDDLKIDQSSENQLQKSIDSEVDSFMEKELESSLADELEELNSLPEVVSEEEPVVEEEIAPIIEESAPMAEESATVIEEPTPVVEEVVDQSVQAPSNITPINNMTSGETPDGFGFKMNFMIGDAHVHMDFKDGLVLTVSGVEVVINEQAGCSVELPGGIKFSVPLDGSEKKKAA